MNKTLKTILFIILFVALLSTISYCTSPYDTETAYITELNDSIGGSGYILRRETMVKRDFTGVFEPLVKDGVRVSRADVVGTVISGNLDEKLAARLEEVSRRIDEINKTDSISSLFSSDDARIYSAMKELCNNIRKYSTQRDYLQAAEYVSQLNALAEKKYSGEKASARDALLVSLEEEKYSIEQQLGGIRSEVTAPSAGIFYTSLDGLEKYGVQEALLNLTTGDIYSFPDICSEFVNEGNTVAKIADTYYWYLAAIVPEEELKDLSIGDEIKISIDEQPDVSAVIMTINPDGAGEAALVVKSDRNVNGMTEKRAVEFEISKDSYRGLKVPAAAIRVVDDVTGVYVMNENRAVSFRAVDILTAHEDYYIVNDKYTPPEGSKFKALKVYDTVLVNPEAARVN